MLKKIWAAFILCSMSVIATPSWAAGSLFDPVLNPIFEYHTTNIQYLRGFNYELGPKTRSIVTVEHADGWKYGDNYFFVDFTQKEDRYAEFAPRLSFSKMTGADLSAGVIKDVLLSGVVESPKHSKPRWLYGGAIDFDLPGFSFFQVNGYVRDNPALSGKTWQSTIAWNAPIEIKQHRFVFEGYADIVGREENSVAYQLIAPVLLWDIGHYNRLDNKVYLGVEWQYWHNKFGVDGVTESVPQLEVRWVF